MKQDNKLNEQLLDEEDVILKSQQNPNAFRVLYEKYYRSIYVFILHRIGDKDISADVCSQVFLKALVNIKRYKMKGLPFSAWLYRIATNECNDYFRKNKRVRMVVLEDRIAENLFEEMFEHEAKDELLSRLPIAMQRLKEDELQLIELRFLESRPFKEVAEILNISENYAKVRTYRILDKMKKLLVQK